MGLIQDGHRKAMERLVPLDERQILSARRQAKRHCDKGGVTAFHFNTRGKLMGTTNLPIKER